MDCPKCGFGFGETAAEGADSCPRCGVVFRKLGKSPDARRPKRRAPPSPVRREPPRSFSYRNVAILSVLFAGTGAFVWQQFSGEEHPAAERPFLVPDEAVPSEVVETAPDAPPAGEATTLVLPGFAPAPAPMPPLEEASGRAIPDLPELNESTVSLALLQRAQEIAREFPDEEGVRAYVAAAYLLLAGKELRSRRWSEALALIDQSETWGAGEGDVAAFRAVVYGEQGSWELAEKWARTALAYGSREYAADMHHLIGKAYYFREEMRKAIEEFQKALALKDDPEIRASLERATREARVSAGFDQKRLSHFIVRYEGETMEDTGRMVLDAMERSYAALVSQLGYEPTEPVVVLLYSRRSYREMGGPHWSAGLFDGKIRVPVQGLTRVDEQIRGTLHHELVHAFIHARAGMAAPRWLHEGLAEYMEGTRAAASGKLLATALREGGSFEECLGRARCDVRLFYPAAASLVDYVIQTRGMGGIRDVLGGLGEGKDIDAALEGVLGRDERALIREWEHFVKRRYN